PCPPSKTSRNAKIRHGKAVFTCYKLGLRHCLTGFDISPPHENKPKKRPHGRHGKSHGKPHRTDKPRKDFDEGPRRIVGVLAKAANGWRLQSANRRERGEFILHAKPRFHLQEGHLAVAEIKPSRGR